MEKSRKQSFFKGRSVSVMPLLFMAYLDYLLHVYTQQNMPFRIGINRF